MVKSEVILDDVTLYFKNIRAVENVSCSLDSGLIYGLIGRNGAGKTSLLSLMASYRQPTGGRVLIHGEDPFENAARMPDVHFVYQRDLREETDSLQDSIRHAAKYRDGFDTGYAEQLIKRFDIDPERPLNKLSMGKQAAAAIIEGLASNAPITLLDEIHHGMDAPSRQLFYESLLECRERQERLFILSTHLISEMSFLFDHILILDRGNLIVNEAYDTFVERGTAITGESSLVEAFVQGHTLIGRKELGGTLSVMLYGTLPAEKLEQARKGGLETTPVSLQELFIHLTDRRQEHDIN